MSERTIGKYENGLSASHLNCGLLRDTFEAAGVEFTEGDGGAGVRLRKADPGRRVKCGLRSRFAGDPAEGRCAL